MTEPFDLIITGGLVVTSQAVQAATLAIRGGQIAGVLAPPERPAARQHLVVDGLHILPGLIDTHVHLRDPARPEREDFVSGTSAAAAGGITTILEMPISEPPVNTGKILAERRRQVQPRALVDFALYGAASHENVAEIPAMAKAGAIAFKTFLTANPPGRAHEFYGLTCPNVGDLLPVMRATAETGLLHCFHCESQPLLDHFKQQVEASGQVDGLAHAASRPPIVEDVSVASLLALADEAGGRVQIVHLSNPRSAKLVQEAKARGLAVTVETCPHYLFLTMDALREHGPFARCNPALRTAEEMEALWSYVLDGTIDVLGTDHAPYRPVEKENGLDNVFKAPAGMPGLEAMLPLVLTAVNQGRLTLPHLARLTAERAAELFRLPRKGRIAPGYDADLALVDMTASWTFDPQQCFTKAKDNMRVYHGWPMQGQVVSTLVRGVTVFDRGEIVAEPGHGQFLRPD